MTELETMVAEAMNKAVMTFRREEQIKNLSIDFVIPREKVAIEVDGTYWHETLAEKDPSIVERERRKEQAIKDAGYTLIRFSEQELRSFGDTYRGRGARVKHIVARISEVASLSGSSRSTISPEESPSIT